MDAVQLSQELLCWITDGQALFFKSPLAGHPRLQTCPACRDLVESPVKMSAEHVLRDCKAIESTRARLGITKFFADYDGELNVSPFAAYLNGFDVNGSMDTVVAHKDRGKALIDLREVWQSVWCNS